MILSLLVKYFFYLKVTFIPKLFCLWKYSMRFLQNAVNKHAMKKWNNNQLLWNHYCSRIFWAILMKESASTWTWLKVMKNILIINLLSKWCSHMNIGPHIKMIPHYIQLILLGLIDTYPYDFIPGKSIPFTSCVSLVLGVVIKTAQYWFLIQQIFQFLQTLLQEITKLLNLQMNVRDYKWRKFSDIIRQKFSSPHFQYRCKTLQCLFTLILFLKLFFCLSFWHAIIYFFYH